jgi:surface antigen
LATKHLARSHNVVAPADSPPPRNALPPKKGQLQNRLLALLTVLVVPGFLLATSFPALAISNNPANANTAPEVADAIAPDDLQSVDVSSGVTIAVERPAFGADTHEQLVARKAAAARIAARAGAFSVVGPRQEGDDYPWRGAGGGLSPLGYNTRQCTDFVAWRLNRDAGSTGAPWKLVWANMTPGGGSASHWASAWNSHGWNTSHTPVIGAVAWFSGNHVAYVKAVNDDGTVFIEEYNWGNRGAYHTRIIPAASVALYLYPPP